MLGALAKVASKVADVGKEILKGLLGTGQSIPKGHQATEPIDYAAIDSSTKVLGLIYATMQRARVAELASRIQDEKDHKDKLDDENKRNDELIKALTVRRKPKKKKKEEPKEEPKKEEKKKPSTKKEEVKKEELKKEVKKEAPPKAEKVTKKEVKPEAKKSEEIKKEAPKEPAPKAEPTTPSAPKPTAPKPSARKETTIGKPSLAKDYAAKASTAAGALNELGLKNPVGVKAFLQVASKESGLDQTSEMGAQAWANTVKKRGAGYANNIFQKNFTEQQYLDAAGKGDDYFFGPNFMSQYSGGWKYRGRGFVGLTHDYNYKNVAAIIKEDIYSNPDLVNKDPKINAKASLAIVALSIGGGKYEKGLEILNSFKNPQEALEYITANVAAGGTGMDPKKLERIKKRGDFIENLKRAESYGNTLDSVVGVPSNQVLPTSLSAGSKIDQASKENKDMKDAANTKKQQTVNNTTVNQTNTQSSSSSDNSEFDDRNAQQKKKG